MLPSKLLIGLLGVLLYLSGCKSDTRSGHTQSPAGQPVNNTFRNPLLPSGPDPWVIAHNGDYYYTHTLGSQIKLWKTRRISDLRNAQTRTIWTPPATGDNAKNLWAPELHYLDNKWYVYYTAGSGHLGTQRTWVLECDSPDPMTGKWTDKGRIFAPGEDYWAIDGTILEIDTSRYFIWSGYVKPGDVTQRLYIARMSNPWTVTGPRRLLSSPTYDWEKNGDPDVNEGPEILQHNGKCFLVYSASGCWTDDYALGMLTLKDNGDPMDSTAWQKSAQPVFTRLTTGGVYGPGHCSFFRSPDGREDWILYHANPQPGQGCGDFRSPRMQRFRWRADGGPDFGRPLPLAETIAVPGGE